MKVPDGFALTLIAGEPMLGQPVCLQFDDVDRLWVVQRSPDPTLPGASGEDASRTALGNVPERPPGSPKGVDRITILSDFDNNDHPRKAADFVTGLDPISGIAFGYGGIFVLQRPNLLFYPDKNHDDIPDSDPEILLKGFGIPDAHPAGNSLTWGPDGWLYGCQGNTATAKVRGLEFQQGIWRFHPVSKRFELFCQSDGKAELTSPYYLC
jgi:hypothetical protein